MTGRQVWQNGRIPVVYQPPPKEPLLVRLPYREDNHEWLEANGRRIHWIPKWKAWQVPRSRFDSVIHLALDRYQACWVIQTYRSLEKCAPACWNALGYECQCSCLGENHGSGRQLEHIVNETFAFEWGLRRLACRLLERKM